MQSDYCHDKVMHKAITTIQSYTYIGNKYLWIEITYITLPIPLPRINIRVPADSLAKGVI